VTTGRFDDLTIERTLGRGAFGKVYLAHDALIGRKVALKVLDDAGTASEGAILREARLVGALVHPNVVTLHRVHPPDRDREKWGFEFEYVDGGTLNDILKVEQRLDGERAVAIARGVAAGLAAAHASGVVHGDVKPANILIGGGGTPKLADFGLGRLIGDLSLRVSQSGGGAGTPAYMAPEVMLGERPTPATDVWSLGVVVYRLASERLPFSGSHLHNLMYGIQNLEPPPLPGDAPPELAATVRACLGKRPEDRPEDAGAVLAILEGTAVAPPQRRREPPLLSMLRGRTDETRVLRSLVLNATAGEGACALIVGEGGAGKSALAAEASQYASAQGAFCVSATASALEGVVRPLLRALHTATRQGEASTRFESSREAIERVLDASAQLRMDTSQPALVTLERALRELLGDGRMCLVIEDLHEGNDDDLRFTLQLAHNMADAGAAVILTARDTDESGAAHVLGAESFVETVAIGLLAEEDAYALLQDQAGARVQPVIAERVFAHARGNPRFTKELFRHMLEREAIAREDDLVVPGPAWGASELPRRFRDLVAQRLGDLAPDQREMLDIAAAAGDEFDGEVVAEVAKRPVLEVLRALQHLYRDRGLVAPTREGYRFASPIVRTVIYRDLASPLRRALHRAFAEQMESREGVDPERVAEQWHRAGEKEKARPFFLDAAFAAARRNERHRAVRLAEAGGLRAERLDPELVSSNADLLLALVNLLEQVGRMDDAMHVVDALTSTGDEVLQLRAETRRADALYRKKGAKALDLDVLDRAAAELPPCLESVIASYLLGVIGKFRGDLDEAERRQEAALAALRSFPHDGFKAMVLDQLASLSLRRGLMEQAERLFRDSAAISERAGRRTEAAVSTINAALAAFHRGALDGLPATLDHAIRRLELGEAHLLAAHARNILALVLYAAGDREGSERAVDEALQPLTDHGYFLGLGDALLQKTTLLFAGGRYDEAIERAEEAWALGEREGLLGVRSVAQAWLCKCRCALGEFADAGRDAASVVEFAGQTEDETIRRGVASLVAESILMGLPPDFDLGPLADRDSDDPREAAVATLADTAAAWETDESDPLHRAATALRGPGIGDRRAELLVLADWLEAEAHGRDGEPAAAARAADTALDAAERLGHAWYVQALRDFASRRPR
jgi:tetratricopeptide (TPR) repeat protein